MDDEIPVDMPMYSNCRTIIEREEEWGLEILIQVRNKSYEGETSLELPGRREVWEETGLEIWYIEGQDIHIEI